MPVRFLDMDDLLTIGFLDVGQGDSIVIILPEGRRAIVVDTPDAEATFEFLQQYNVEVLEYVFITHLDSDHAEGIIELVDQFRGRVSNMAFNIDQIVPADLGLRRKLKARLRELSELEARGVGLHHLTIPDIKPIKFDGEVMLTLIHPSYGNLTKAIASGCQNEASGVLVVEYMGKRILLAADIGTTGWQQLLERGSDTRAEVCCQSAKWDTF